MPDVSPIPSAPGTAPAAPPLLCVRHLTKHFPVQQGLLGTTVGQVQAVTDVSFDVGARQTVGLVGESGCGKTTVGRTILRLLEPTSGQIEFEGTSITALSHTALRPYRRRMQIVFQDPYASLNPRMNVAQIVGEGLVVHGIGGTARQRGEIVDELLARVGLPARSGPRYPHEFSGGQRQRIGIARALAVDPSFIVCDEPVSALDVSVQAQIINLLMDLQTQRGVSYLFIAHDLSVVAHISQRVIVMYLGHIVEMADTAELYSDPRHPYTRALLSAVPRRTPDEVKTRQNVRGEPPSPINPPPGCPFAPRCPIARPECSAALPKLEALGAPGHLVRCPWVR